MIRFVVGLLTIPLLGLACHIMSPQEVSKSVQVSGVVQLGSVEITASAELDAENLHVTARLNNIGAEAVRLALLGGNCSLLLRLYDVNSDTDTALLDEAPPGAICQDVGGEVTIAGGESYTLTTTRARSSLRASGVAAGRFRVVAVLGEVEGERFLSVHAGVVDLS